MTYPGSQESQDRPSSQNVRLGKDVDVHGNGGGAEPEQGRDEVRHSDGLEEDAWLRIFEDEIASSSRAAIEGMPSSQVTESKEHVTADDTRGSPASKQRLGAAGFAAAQTAAPGAQAHSARQHFAGRRHGRRLAQVGERFKAGFANWRQGFAALPRRSSAGC